MASTTLVSVDAYLATIYEPDCEYIDGEILERNVGETDHGGLQGLLTAWLLNRRKELGIHVFPETRTQVAARRFRIPDIAVTRQKAKGRILREPPSFSIARIFAWAKKRRFLRNETTGSGYGGCPLQRMVAASPQRELRRQHAAARNVLSAAY